ncbi:Putative Na+/H+ antiporter [Rhodococcus wratislaviensis]|uniref:Na+/H+ antiporter n=1 Tax=Rhodococcus wratislaviensis TaxID=44752 RepID=A0A402CF96_RHOWR|nr:hypothetical protein [Rhodococcus wratislaviensis]GCE42282.1 Putative Na+/H+ antiporter [Rhodococcus wratislaviensis]
MGLEFRQIVDDAGIDLWTMVWQGVVIGVVLVVVRALWMGVTWLYIRGWEDNASSAPRTPAEAVVMTWCGMRGLVTLALALSLPVDDFPVAVRSRRHRGRRAGDEHGHSGIHAAVAGEGARRRRGRGRGGRRGTGTGRAGPARAARGRDLRAHHAATRIGGPARGLCDRLEEDSAPGTHSPEYSQRIEQLETRRDELRALQRAAQAEVLRARNEKGQDPHVVDRVLERLDRLSSASNTQTFHH